MGRAIRPLDLGETSAPSTSIEKALTVLLAFDGRHQSLSLSELVLQLAIPRPTVHRILKQLGERGFVRQLPSKRYQIGLTVFELGSRVSDQVQLRIPAIPHIHALYQRVDSAVYLSIWTGDEVLHLDCLPSRSEAPLPARAGGRWVAHCASVGKVLLAHSTPSELKNYLARPLKAVTRHTITDTNELLTHLALVREQRFATTIEESLLGVFGVAAPIKDGDGKVVAAICIAGRDRSLLERASEVIRTANAISHDIASSNLSRRVRREF
jgi:IclR family acetate operon transcriptional repressor